MQSEGNNNASPDNNDNVVEFPKGGRQGIIDKLTKDIDTLKEELKHLNLTSREGVIKYRKIKKQIADLQVAKFGHLQALGEFNKSENDNDNGDDNPPSRVS